MIYKLSNIASIERIETFTKLPFKYPYLHKPKRKINGLKEQTVCIINMENPNQIMQAIWGLLPQNYGDNWNKFQHIKQTLHINKEEIKNNILFKEALYLRRCLFIVTGFYIHKVINGVVENYLVEKDNQKPFYLAGLYNITNDGFYTCSVINTKLIGKLNDFNNLYQVMPIQIPEIFKNMWLNKKSEIIDINYLMSTPYITNLKVQRIASKKENV
ncbi:SOS response-associated peptidase family protein [Tenacibaculum sp. IMCC1]|uniref:Abasic site processing protein n=1 Tax=Tenacibaculum sp. Pbs-1 TaxID=3238748 RepID=A0AB33KRK0_9FLAO